MPISLSIKQLGPAVGWVGKFGHNSTENKVGEQRIDRAESEPLVDLTGCNTIYLFLE